MQYSLYRSDSRGEKLMNQEPNREIITSQNRDGNIKIDVRIEEKTVWLTLELVAYLFGKARSTITEHTGNIFKEGALIEEAGCRDFRHTTNPGT